MKLEIGRMAAFLLAADFMLLTACGGRVQTETNEVQPGHSEAGESRQEADTEESNPKQGLFSDSQETARHIFRHISQQANDGGRGGYVVREMGRAAR